MGRKTISIEESKLMIDLYRCGYGTGQLAKDFGYHRSSVQMMLRRNGIERNTSAIPRL